jgi:hypothetical protein
MINVYAPINLLGYGIHASNMIKAMSEAGMDINLTTIGSIQSDPYFEDSWRKAQDNLKDFSSKNPSLFIFHDEMSNQACGAPLCVFSIFETSTPKEQSIAMLKNGPADIILTTTQMHKQYLDALNIGKPVHVVNEGVDDTIFNTIPVDKHIDTGKFTYLTVGKKEARKNTSMIVKAFIEDMQDKEVALVAHTFNPFANTEKVHPFKNLASWSDVNPIEHGFEYKGWDGKAHKFSKNACDIYFTAPGLPTSMMSSLYHSANVGIQISRGEGWDLPCFTPNTKVQTLDSSWKNIQDIEIGEYVSTDKGDFKKVTRKYVNNIKDKNLFKLDVVGNNVPIYATEEHPLLGIKRSKVKKIKGTFNFQSDQVEFIKVKDLEKGDFLVKTPIKENTYLTTEGKVFDLYSLDSNLEKSNDEVWYKTGFNKNGTPIRLNRFIDLAKCSYILGLFLAEGSFDGNKVTISLHSKERDIARKFVEDINSLFGYSTNWFKQYGNKYYIEFGSKLIGAFFEHFCGNGSHNKMLKQKLDTTVIAEDIINAAFIGDGHTTKKGWKLYTTVSETFANQYFAILQNKGYCPIFQKKIRKDKNSIEYVISWLPDKTHTHSRKMWYNEFIGTITTIKNIKQEEYTDLVYNLEVEDHNTYQLQSFTVHNCTEMLACGLPTIASNCLGHVEYLDHTGLPEIQKELVLSCYDTEVADDGIWFKGNMGEWSVIDEAAFKAKLNKTWEEKERYEEKSDDLADKMVENFAWSKAVDQFNNTIS